MALRDRNVPPRVLKHLRLGRECLGTIPTAVVVSSTLVPAAQVMMIASASAEIVAQHLGDGVCWFVTLSSLLDTRGCTGHSSFASVPRACGQHHAIEGSRPHVRGVRSLDRHASRESRWFGVTT